MKNENTKQSQIGGKLLRKGICEQCVDNNILHGQSWFSPQRSGARQGCLCSPHSQYCTRGSGSENYAIKGNK